MKKPTTNNSVIEDAISMAQKAPERVLGHVEVTKVIREHMPLLQAEEYGPSIGQQIDGMLASAVRNGDELQSFKLEFEPERWGLFAKTVTDSNQSEAYSKY